MSVTLPPKISVCMPPLTRVFQGNLQAHNTQTHKKRSWHSHLASSMYNTYEYCKSNLCWGVHCSGNRLVRVKYSWENYGKHTKF